ncbi:MAG: hypothetical protein Q8N09_02100 [Thermodesulfovibrionia bacterium]|nr:hypothetical protein [Thermodesulfovibrionia bacterium]
MVFPIFLCHCEERSDKAISKACPEQNERDEILHGVYPEQKDEILRFAQNDMRRVQNDRERRDLNDRL